MMWIKCCAKLLTSVCSKQKNFLSINQPALHTTLRQVFKLTSELYLCFYT